MVRSMHLVWTVVCVFGLTLAMSASASAVLVGHYKLDETTAGPVVNEVGTDGTNMGATINQAGQIVRAYDFNGSSQYTTMADPGIGGGAYSVSAWINADSLATGNVTWGAGIVRSTSGENIGDFFLSVDHLGSLHFANWRNVGSDIDGISYSATGVISTGTWTHVAATWDGAVNRLYVDGAPITISGTEGTSTGWGTESSIGRQYTIAGYFFNGLIDDVGIWTGEALSDEAIGEIYANGLLGLDLAFVPQPLPAPEPASGTLCLLGLMAVLRLKKKRA